MDSQQKSWGVSIFCDDYRQEVDGKFSLMGIYQSEINLSGEFPAMVPKFVIFVRYLEIKNAFTDNLLLNVFFPGDNDQYPSYSNSFERMSTKSTDDVETGQNSLLAVANWAIPLVFSPLIIRQEGSIKVRMQSGSHVTKLGVLPVKKYRLPDASMAS